jgi:Lipocalin-like domain
MKALLVLTLCSLASCAGLQGISPSSLVGEWRYTDKTKGCHYLFNRNGTFSGDVVYHGKTISKFTGRWSIDGDTLLYTYASDALDRIPAGATDRDRLLNVQREFFVIEAADGSKRKYLRVPGEKKPRTSA